MQADMRANPEATCIFEPKCGSDVPRHEPISQLRTQLLDVAQQFLNLEWQICELTLKQLALWSLYAA